MSEKTRFENVTGIYPPKKKEDDKPPNPRRCETCVHSEPPEPNRDQGQCIANYPVLFAIPSAVAGQMGAVSMFPPMKANQRCGKWTDPKTLTSADIYSA